MFLKELKEFNHTEFNSFLKKEIVNIFQKEKRLSDIDLNSFLTVNDGLFYILENQKELIDKIIKDSSIEKLSNKDDFFNKEKSSLKTLLKFFENNAFIVDNENKQLFYYKSFPEEKNTYLKNNNSLKIIKNFSFSKNSLDFCRYFLFLDKKSMLSKKDFNKVILSINKKCLDKISKYFEKLLKFIKVLKDIDSNENYNLIIINIYLNFITNINLLNERFDTSIQSVYLDWLKNNDKETTLITSSHCELKNYETWGITNLNKNDLLSNNSPYNDII